MNIKDMNVKDRLLSVAIVVLVVWMLVRKVDQVYETFFKKEEPIEYSNQLIYQDVDKYFEEENYNRVVKDMVEKMYKQSGIEIEIE